MVFFFKQKTAYDIGVRLVGSEIGIRDSPCTGAGKTMGLNVVKGERNGKGENEVFAPCRGRAASYIMKM